MGWLSSSRQDRSGEVIPTYCVLNLQRWHTVASRQGITPSSNYAFCRSCVSLSIYHLFDCDTLFSIKCMIFTYTSKVVFSFTVLCHVETQIIICLLRILVKRQKFPLSSFLPDSIILLLIHSSS